MMDLSLINLSGHLWVENARQEVIQCNKYSKNYGLTLSEEDVTELVECRKNALKDTGRIEFGGGILPKLIYAFCDSPFIYKDTYVSTLSELQEAFYYYKGEAEELYTDDELIDFMVKVFNGKAQGSLEYLSGTTLATLCKFAKEGMSIDEVGELY